MAKRPYRYMKPRWRKERPKDWWRSRYYPVGDWSYMIEDWPDELAYEQYNQQVSKYNEAMRKYREKLNDWYAKGQEGDRPTEPVRPELPAKPPKDYDPGMPMGLAKQLFGKQPVRERFGEWLAGHPELGPQPREGMITPEQYEAWQESPFYKDWAGTMFYPGGSPGEMKIDYGMEGYKEALRARQQEQIEAHAQREPGGPTPPVPTAQTIDEGEIMPTYGGGMPGGRRRGRMPGGMPRRRGRYPGGLGTLGFGGIEEAPPEEGPYTPWTRRMERRAQPVPTEPGADYGFLGGFPGRSGGGGRVPGGGRIPGGRGGGRIPGGRGGGRGFSPLRGGGIFEGPPDTGGGGFPSPPYSPVPTEPGAGYEFLGGQMPYDEWADKMRFHGYLPADYLTGIWPPRSRSMAMRGQPRTPPRYGRY